MGYRNKTYVIFDGDNDMWAYRFIRGWKVNERIGFNFYDAHDLKPLNKDIPEEATKKRLRERLSNTKQALVLIGSSTKNLYRFVRWELQTCLQLYIPLIAVNLNNTKGYDADLCPPIIRDQYVVHIPFKLKAIQYALDNFPEEYHKRNKADIGPRYYSNDVYKKLGV